VWSSAFGWAHVLGEDPHLRLKSLPPPPPHTAAGAGGAEPAADSLFTSPASASKAKRKKVEENGGGGGGHRLAAGCTTPHRVPRELLGRSGLMNLGATCYMNSNLQSLFMNRAFRRAIYRFRGDEARDRRAVRTAPPPLPPLPPPIQLRAPSHIVRPGGGSVRQRDEAAVRVHGGGNSMAPPQCLTTFTASVQLTIAKAYAPTQFTELLGLAAQEQQVCLPPCCRLCVSEGPRTAGRRRVQQPAAGSSGARPHDRLGQGCGPGRHLRANARTLARMA
jgi:hypothetical protein